MTTDDLTRIRSAIGLVTVDLPAIDDLLGEADALTRVHEDETGDMPDLAALRARLRVAEGLLTAAASRVRSAREAYDWAVL